MRAAVIEHRHEPGAIRDVPIPEPGPGEVQVRVSVAGINPVDWKIRDGDDRPLPYILGQDFAGTATALGAGVRKYAVGDRLFGIAREHGAYAEYTVVPEDSHMQPVANIPSGVGDADAAALPTAGLTALACVERMDVTAGQVLFIVGVTGSVGQLATQIARVRGARVGGSGSAANAAIANALRLDTYVAYDREDAAAAIRTAFPQGVDALLDLADDAARVRALMPVVRSGGIVASTIRGVDEDAARQQGLRGLNVSLFQSPQSSHDGLRRLGAYVERGDVRVPIAAERNLSDAIAALDLVKSGTITGKMLLTI